MASTGRNGLVTIAGQLESWIICDFKGDKITRVSWSSFAPAWAKEITNGVLTLPLEQSPLIVAKLFSQVVDDIDHVANTVCGDPVSVNELCDQIRPGFAYPQELPELVEWMRTGSPIQYMNQVLSSTEKVSSVHELLSKSVEILADDMIHDVSAAIARLVEDFEEEHAQED